MESAFACEPASFQGTQALLLRRAAIPRLLTARAGLEGVHSRRLAAFFGNDSPIWIHRPSLVQHVATDSSWGARIYRAGFLKASR